MSMIDTVSPVCIKGEDLQEWLQAALADALPGKQLYMIHEPGEARGESRYFSEVHLDQELSLGDLVKREVVEHSRGDYVHFYVKDVVSAACSANALSGRWFWIYHTW